RHPPFRRRPHRNAWRSRYGDGLELAPPATGPLPSLPPPSRKSAASRDHSPIDWKARNDGRMRRKSEVTLLLALSALPGEVKSPRRKGFAPNQYVGANPYRQSLQLWRDLLRQEVRADTNLCIMPA